MLSIYKDTCALAFCWSQFKRSMSMGWTAVLSTWYSIVGSGGTMTWVFLFLFMFLFAFIIASYSARVGTIRMSSSQGKLITIALDLIGFFFWSLAMTSSTLRMNSFSESGYFLVLAEIGFYRASTSSTLRMNSFSGSGFCFLESEKRFCQYST